MDSCTTVDEPHPGGYKFGLKQLPVTDVIVYNDRAEVQRTLSASLVKGENELSLGGLSTKIDPGSVRVAGISGNATIVEVSTYLKSHTKVGAPVDEARALELEADRLALQNDMKVLQKTLTRIRAERSWLDSYATTKKQGFPEHGVLTENYVSGALAFMDFYSQKMDSIDKEELKTELETARVTREIDNLTTQISKIRNSKEPDVTTQYTYVVIILHAEEPMDIQLHLKYLIPGAHWTASYDARVMEAHQSVELTYYGNIINNTGEDWFETSLSLSTAKPSNPGEPPTLLGTMLVQLVYKGGYNSYTNPDYNNPIYNQQAWSSDFHGTPSSGGGPSTSLAQAASVSDSSNSAVSFLIPRRPTIASDNKEHKVTINVLDLPAKFEYSLAPKISTSAYLKANIKNASQFPLLPGPLNVFIEGDFVTKSKISSPISPEESMGIFLGTDEAIKVMYTQDKKIRKETGVFQKTSCMELSSRIIVTNNCKKDITIIIFEQVPKSNTAQLVVTLLEPAGLKPPEDLSKINLDALVMLTPANNIRWKKVIKKGKRREFKYVSTIEYPSDKSVDLGTGVTTISAPYAPSPPTPASSVNSLLSGLVERKEATYSVAKSFNPLYYNENEAVCDYAMM